MSRPRWELRWSVVSTMVLLLMVTACGMFRPTFDEAKKELAGLIDPALRAALAGVTIEPERVAGMDHCSDPFVGPSQGERPTLTYRIPLSALGQDPKRFVLEAEKVWKAQGLLIETDETEGVFSRFASNPDYKMDAFVNFNNAEAMIVGSGPCVDAP